MPAFCLQLSNNEFFGCEDGVDENYPRQRELLQEPTIP